MFETRFRSKEKEKSKERKKKQRIQGKKHGKIATDARCSSRVLRVKKEEEKEKEKKRNIELAENRAPSDSKRWQIEREMADT